MNLKKYLLAVVIALTGLQMSQASASPLTAPIILKFFGGQIVAELNWVAPPAFGKKAKIQVEVKNSLGQPLNYDTSEIKAFLLMPEMPDMGVEEQKTVSLADSSGNPIPGKFLINNMNFSMAGVWALRIAIPAAPDSSTVESQDYNFRVQ